jgi:Rrf2 family protein
MSLIKISEGASLAMHAMALIARDGSRRLKVRELAEHLGASRAHMAKVFQKLAASGLVDSTRGPAGGFELGRDPDDITFLDILEVMDGKIKLDGCPFDRKSCAFEDCIFRGEVARISRDIHHMYGKITLSDYVREGNGQISHGEES